MPGLVGIFDLSGKGRVNSRTVDLMRETISHRDLSSSVVWISEDRNFGTVCRKKRITESFILIDGEIFNESDEESVVSGFKRNSINWGKFLRSLSGNFALGFWDSSSKKLLLAKDKMGVKPLYYATENELLFFASEIKAILKVLQSRPTVDLGSLYYFLTFGLTWPPKTLFEKIYKLPPGHFALVSKDEFTIRKYWEIGENKESYSKSTEQELAKELLSILEHSVGKRIGGATQVSAMLSGGVDTSTISSLLTKMGTKVFTFNGGFRDRDGYNEFSQAEAVARYLHTIHREVEISQKDFISLLLQSLQFQEEPMGPEAVVVYAALKRAGELAPSRVFFGDGSDGLFAGFNKTMSYLKFYNRFAKHVSFASNIPKLLKEGLLSLFQFLSNIGLFRFPGITHGAEIELIRRFLAGEEIFQNIPNFGENLKRRILSKWYAGITRELSSNLVVKGIKEHYESLGRGGDYVDWMCYLDVIALPESLIARAEKFAAAFNLKAQFPFVDEEVVNFAFSMPPYLKYKNYVPKYILKQAVSSIVPKDVLERRKQGLSTPLKDWFSSSWGQIIAEKLREFTADTEYFEWRELEKILDYQIKGDRNYLPLIWSIFIFSLWHEKWIEGKSIEEISKSLT
jgi:asparagine synthase (glutamine-hydrolysing)